MYGVIITPAYCLSFVCRFPFHVYIIDSGFSVLQQISISIHTFWCARIGFVSHPYFYIVVSIPLRWQAFHFVNSKAGWSSHPPTGPGMVLSAGGLAQDLGGGWSSFAPPGRLIRHPRNSLSAPFRPTNPWQLLCPPGPCTPEYIGLFLPPTAMQSPCASHPTQLLLT